VRGPGAVLRAILARLGLPVPAQDGFPGPVQDGLPGWGFVDLVETRGQVEPLQPDGQAAEQSPSSPALEAAGWQACLRT